MDSWYEFRVRELVWSSTNLRFLAANARVMQTGPEHCSATRVWKIERPSVDARQVHRLASEWEAPSHRTRCVECVCDRTRRSTHAHNALLTHQRDECCDGFVSS